MEGSSWAEVSFAEPVGQPFRVRHSRRREGPAAAWMAPSWREGKGDR